MDSLNLKNLRVVVPGEEIARESKGFMAGWGTYSDNGIIYSAFAGTVQTTNKLITVQPKQSPYKAEVGDVVIGRISLVDKKSWRVDINSIREANLNLTSINLPKGEQRRRSEEDKLIMRTFFDESDLLSGEIQQVHSDGGINMQTRNLKYGKLNNGILLEVNHNLIKKMKYHFVDLAHDVKAIIGRNGYVWVYYSTISVEKEYFTDDQNKVHTLNKFESPTENAAVHIILFKQIIEILNKFNFFINKNSIMHMYNNFVASIKEQLDTSTNPVEILRNNLYLNDEVASLLLKDLKNK